MKVKINLVNKIGREMSGGWSINCHEMIAVLLFNRGVVNNFQVLQEPRLPKANRRMFNQYEQTCRTKRMIYWSRDMRHCQAHVLHSEHRQNFYCTTHITSGHVHWSALLRVTIRRAGGLQSEAASCQVFRGSLRDKITWSQPLSGLSLPLWLTGIILPVPYYIGYYYLHLLDTWVPLWV